MSLLYYIKTVKATTIFKIKLTLRLFVLLKLSLTQLKVSPYKVDTSSRLS